MKTNKIVAGIITASLLVTSLGVASANFANFSKYKKSHRIELTKEERTEVKNMTKEERKKFFNEKKTERKAQREARENLIDKLLAGEKLTSDEEKLREKIIQERAERMEN